MRQTSNVPAFLAGGMAGAGLGAAASKGRPGSTSPPATSAPSAYSQSQSQYAPSSSEPSQYPDYAAYNPYVQPGAQPQGYQPGGFAAEFSRHPSAGPSSGYSQTGSSSTGQPLLGGAIPSAKEREAYQRRTGMQLANPGEVVQHQDGGRVPQPGNPEEEEGEAPMEVPPRYDQIRD